MVTVGRVLFALVARWFPPNRTYHVLPFLLAITFVVIAALPAGHPWADIVAFALAGFRLLRAPAVVTSASGRNSWWSWVPLWRVG